MARLLLGKEVVAAMKERILQDVQQLNKKGIVPGLGIIRLGARPDDLAYERGAVKRCEGLGIKCTVFEYSEDLSQDKLINEIKKINDDMSIHGILIFRPLPKHIDEAVIKYVINADKDIDCLNPVNVAKVFEGDETGFAPCTPEAVIEKQFIHIQIIIPFIILNTSFATSLGNISCREKPQNNKKQFLVVQSILVRHFG
jgi:methylenetetrahydrofolate dehydrogenase (NADP+)/methenyltetrahydrofolate cyclohydrolase